MFGDESNLQQTTFWGWKVWERYDYLPGQQLFHFFFAGDNQTSSNQHIKTTQQIIRISESDEPSEPGGKQNVKLSTGPLFNYVRRFGNFQSHRVFTYIRLRFWHTPLLLLLPHSLSFAERNFCDFRESQPSAAHNSFHMTLQGLFSSHKSTHGIWKNYVQILAVYEICRPRNLRKGVQIFASTCCRPR